MNEVIRRRDFPSAEPCLAAILILGVLGVVLLIVLICVLILIGILILVLVLILVIHSEFLRFVLCGDTATVV